MSNGAEKNELMKISDNSGYEYDLSVIPEYGTPLIKAASVEILQDMQVSSIIQNLENVGRLMFIAYNALSGTKIQSSMSRIQKKYLDLMDDSSQTITSFEQRSKEICKNVSDAYSWLLKGKEGMALKQFSKCAAAASEMADKAEALADGFKTLSDDAEVVLENTQTESALQYQKMDEIREQMQQYNAKLQKYQSLQKSLDKHIKDVNDAYQSAKEKENDLFDMKKGLMITQIVTSCIGAIIPSASSVKSSGESGKQQMADATQGSLQEKEAEQQNLSQKKEKQQTDLEQLKQKKAALEKEIQDLERNIEVEKGVTAREPQEKEENLRNYNDTLEQKKSELTKLDQQIKQAETTLNDIGDKLNVVNEVIGKLNEQLSAYAAACMDDYQRAQQATKKAFEEKLELEKQQRETLASIQEFTGLISASVAQKNVAETAVQTLGVAIRCIKQIVVALTTAAKFWRSMESYCRTLSDQSMGQVIKELSEELTLEERMEYYQDYDFKMTFLNYICRWAALYYVCNDYRMKSNKIRDMVAGNIESSSSREEEWKMAGELAEQMGMSVKLQVDESNAAISALEEGVA